MTKNSKLKLSLIIILIVVVLINILPLVKAHYMMEKQHTIYNDTSK